MFFGTNERKEKDDTVQPRAGHWLECRFSTFCHSMASVPLPKGIASDQQERELDLFYNMLYEVFMHLTSAHSDRRRLIREVRYRMSEVTVQRTKAMLQVKRKQDHDHDKDEDEGQGHERDPVSGTDDDKSKRQEDDAEVAA